MKYLLLICDDEKAWAKLTEAERGAVYREYRKLIDELTVKGQYLGGAQLQPTSTATNVRVRNGNQLVTDGPFAETAEQLGGYFLIAAANLDEAIQVAAKIPSARIGTIEVRPLAESESPATV
jgi:hypothetical protein